MFPEKSGYASFVPIPMKQPYLVDFIDRGRGKRFRSSESLGSIRQDQQAGPLTRADMPDDVRACNEKRPGHTGTVGRHRSSRGNQTCQDDGK